MAMGELILGTLLLLQAPEQAWRAVGSPASGVVSTDAWVFSGTERASNPDSKGFEMVELAECQQLSVEALVLHCVGTPNAADPRLPAEVRQIIDSALDGWTSLQVKTAGLVWVSLERSAGQDRAVAALPAAACTKLAELRDWTPRVVEMAQRDPSWLVPAALTAVAPADATTRALLTLVAGRIDSATRQPKWPEGFIRLPQGIAERECKALTLQELAQILELRSGDPVVLKAMCDRCNGLGLTAVASELKGLRTTLGWSEVAPEPNGPWTLVDCTGLQPQLIAIVRAGGAIPAQAAPPSTVATQAARAFQLSPPDLDAAERLASEAAKSPIPDALNLLAAIRLSKPDAGPTDLAQALAFAWQARALAPDHPYADVNIIRALQRLGQRDQARALLAIAPKGTEGSWRHRQLMSLTETLRD